MAQMPEPIQQRMAQMNGPIDMIKHATDYVLGHNRNDVAAFDAYDKYFISDIIRCISTAINEDGRPTNVLIELSVELGTYAPEKYRGVKELRENALNGYDGYRCAVPWGHINMELANVITAESENKLPVVIDKMVATYCFDICATYHAFVNALCIVHDAGYTFDMLYDILGEFNVRYKRR